MIYLTTCRFFQLAVETLITTLPLKEKAYVVRDFKDDLVSFSKICVKTERVEIGRKFAGSMMSPPLSTGVTFEILRMSGTIPCAIEWLYKSVIDRFQSRGKQLCKLLGIKESFNM